MPRKKTRGTAAGRLSTINADAAGLDIGSTFHVVAVPSDRDDQPVRTFRTFSRDLHQLADWLTDVGITTVAMESTGVYWIPVFEILEARGFEVLLVNARDVKHVPGRKSDVNDAQWLQQLHQHGLLRGSFRPRDNVVRLRAYLRQRERLVDYAAAHIQHMQKALMQMNVQLHHVVTDITGLTGLRIIRAIVAGNHAPEQLAAFRDRRCHASEATIREALIGNYRPEHVFALRQALELYDVHQAKVAECDVEIEAVLGGLNAQRVTPEAPLPRVRHAKGRNEPAFEVRSALYTLLGADLSQIHGFGPYTVLRLVAECGRHDQMGHGQALHLVAEPGPRQQDLRRSTPQLKDPPVVESRHRRATHRGGQYWENPDGARRLLPTPRGPDGESQGRDRDRSQARDSVLQRPPIRYPPCQYKRDTLSPRN